MKAAVLYGKQDLRYSEIETPVPGPDEVVIAVKAVGICGSDLPRVLADAAHFYPIVLGHEFSGVIHQVGENVKNIHVGQRATAAPLLPCFECEDCKKGDFALCKHYRFTGSSTFGAFADYVKVPARNVVTFADSVSFEQAAFFEPATVARHGMACVGLNGPCESVAILGAGTNGMFVLQWAKILGAKKVAVFDINSKRLELAKQFGADCVFNTGEEDFLQKAQEWIPGGFEYVFECAGQNVTMSMAFELAANKAKVCFIGTSSKDLHFPWKLFEKMNRKEFLLTGSWMSYSAPFPGMEWTETARCFSEGSLKYDPEMVFAKYPMCQAAEAFELFKTPGAVGGKVLLVNE